MAEMLVLGALQGFAEWLPVSSEGLIVLARTQFFGSAALGDDIRLALFLHMGTFFAALVYFRADVLILFRALIRFRSAAESEHRVFLFLVVATLISGALGGALLFALQEFEETIALSGRIVTAAVGLLLLVTAAAHFRKKVAVLPRREAEASVRDGVLLGIVQGCAALPGLSRSGLTVAALLFRGFDDTAALRLSFLMSMPIVLAGNIILNFGRFAFSPALVVGATVAFAVGLATIHGALVVARKIPWGWFLLAFGLLTLVAAFIG